MENNDNTSPAAENEAPRRKYRFAKRPTNIHVVLRPKIGIPTYEPDIVQQTRVVKKISRDTPPNLPFLRFDAIVGRGGMAVVWRAWHKELQRYVAVKVLDEKFTTTGQDIRRFRVDLRVHCGINHQPCHGLCNREGSGKAPDDQRHKHDQQGYDHHHSAGAGDVDILAQLLLPFFRTPLAAKRGFGSIPVILPVLLSHLTPPGSFFFQIIV